VEIIWVHSTAQARGLAHRLLEVAAGQVDQPVASFGWRRPFTPSGEALVRRCCAEGFWVPD
jgi:nicotinic acid phosphoribosyltransferase